MVDGTPVLDIKPFIPQYDSPLQTGPGGPDVRLMDGCESETETSSLLPEGAAESISIVFPSHSERVMAEGITAPTTTVRIGEREAPDGEEETSDIAQSAYRMAARDVVRVPEWVTHSPTPELNVAFSERARAQLESLAAENESGRTEATAETIAAVLREDPRSVYLRRRWGSQFYTFLIADLHVSCKFDDSAHSVNVFQVRSAGKMCECGHLEWQCSLHGTTSE